MKNEKQTECDTCFYHSEKYGHSFDMKRKEKNKAECERCGKEIQGQPAAMAFRKGDPNDPYYFCIDCSPDPFEKLKANPSPQSH